jgi:predicted Ser/Thr protein kinase
MQPETAAMTEQAPCPKCGTQLPADAPVGLCPKCLVQAGFESEPQPAPTAASPPSSRFEPPAVADLAGKFPQLEILELLGKGGMGAVYKARQRGLDRLVAVKVLPPEIGHDGAFAERFTREARALARLSHNHIVSVFDFGQADGLFYIVMEYVDGVNLRQTIQTGKLTPAEALAIVPQICEALQFAHDEGIVHRDIKPENILIDKRGRVKIADFGLAKLMASGGRESPDALLTATHQVMGTLRYMAPEQMQGSREVDHRADIYSLGVIFYELLTGELPMGKFAPPSKKVQIDVRLDEIVLRALEPDPEQRYQHASEVKTDVQTVSSSALASKEGQTGLPAKLRSALAGGSPEPSRSRFPFGFSTLFAATAGGSFLISLGGIACALFPWGQIYQPSFKTWSSVAGVGWWQGMLSGGLFGGVLLLLASTVVLKPVPLWRPLLTFLAGIGTVVAVSSYLLEMSNGSLPVQPLLHAASWGIRIEGREATTINEANVFAKAGKSPYVTLALAASLLLLAAIELGAILKQRANDKVRTDLVSLPNTAKSGRGPVAGLPETQIRFLVSDTSDVPRQAIFHFSTLGYRLIEQRPDVCIFERGNKWAGLWAFDIRKLHTTLTVRTAPAADGQLWVSCTWSLRKLGSWVPASDIDKLEAEGLGLEALLNENTRTDPGSRPRAGTVAIVSAPRFSRFAIVGGVWALFGLLAVIPALLFDAWRPTPVPVAASGVIQLQIPWPVMLMSILGATAPLGTTICGVLALFHIRHSGGRVYGLPLAVADALFFPLLIINGTIFGVLLYFNHSGLELNFAMSLFLALAETVFIGGGVSSAIVTRVWAAVSSAGEKSGTGETGMIGPASLPEAKGAAAVAPAPSQATDGMFSLFFKAWDEWWAERAKWFTTSVQVVLFLVHLVCLIGFISMTSSGNWDEQGRRQFTYQLGVPSPWFRFETWPDSTTAFRHGIYPWNSSLLLAITGLAVGYVLCRIEKARNPKAGFWHSPGAMFIIWLVLALIALGTGTIMGFAMASQRRPIAAVRPAAVPPLGTITSGIGVTFTVPAGQVAVFEIVTRRDNATVPLPPHCGYVMAADKPVESTFRWSPGPEDVAAPGGRRSWDIEIRTAGGGGGSTGSVHLPEGLDSAVGARSLGLGVLEPNQEIVDWGGGTDASKLPANGLIGLRVTVVRHGLNKSGSGTGHTDWKTPPPSSTTRRKLL